MKILRVFALGFVAYVIAAFLLKLSKGRTATEAATQSIVEPIGFIGSLITVAANPSKWDDALDITKKATKTVVENPSYDNASDVANDWVTQFFGLASERPSPESVADSNARTLAETQIPGTLDANPSGSRGLVYTGSLY